MTQCDVPKSVRAAAAAELDGEFNYRIELFELRLSRWWADLCEPLEQLYGAAATELADRLVGLAARAYRDRDAELTRLDLRRALQPDWFQRPSTIGYAAYTERFAGTLSGVLDRIEHLKRLGVTYLHLMPVLKPRDGDNDGGYAVADYRAIRTDLGDVKDLTALSSALRSEGISLVLDLVLNHVAREHEWGRLARAGSARHRNYFRSHPDRVVPDKYELTLPEVFPDFAPGNFSWDEQLQAWVWTTFNSWQWDLDWSNPDVFAEFADIVFFLANAGVEVLRLDAVAFLWKRMGTDCQNQPEVHLIIQALRTLGRIACPALIFKAEAIVGPGDLIQYLGVGRRHGKVSDLAYHNTLMVQTWSMLATGETTLAAHALQGLPPAPGATAWITYVRCHDDIGWAIDDADAAAVGLNGHAHRAFLADFYSGEYPTSTARGLVFQHNLATADRRISGSTASLAGLESAQASADPTLIDAAIARILLSYAISYGWGGIPVIWSGDEMAAVNDPDWAAEPGHEHDNRWAHRPRLRPDFADARDDVSTPTGRVFAALAALGRTRARLPHLHAGIASQVLATSDPAILPVLRAHPIGNLLQLYNVSSTWRPWPVSRVDELGLRDAREVLADASLTPDGAGQLWLPPYAAWWIVDDLA